MKNSRKDGIMIVKCNNPYTMDFQGEKVERYIVTCKEPTYEVEDIAFDLEQLARKALLTIPQRNTETQQNVEEDDSENFYDNEMPSCEEVEKFGTGIEMIISMSNEVKISDMMKIFQKLLKYKLIIAEENIVMTLPIWQTIHRDDKIKILMCYIAFFVNPLQKLLKSSKKMEKNIL